MYVCMCVYIYIEGLGFRVYKGFGFSINNVKQPQILNPSSSKP